MKKYAYNAFAGLGYLVTVASIIYTGLIIAAGVGSGGYFGFLASLGLSIGVNCGLFHVSNRLQEQARKLA